MLEFQLLKLRNLIASKEAEIAVYNREIGVCEHDHIGAIHKIDEEINKLIKEIDHLITSST